MDHVTRLSIQRSPDAVAVGLISSILLGFGESGAVAQTERSTALVTIAQANDQCLI